MMILIIVLGLAALVCAVQAIRTQRLLISAIWLAGTSALTALLLFILGAHEVAVIELSVGAGLVTVLFVFAINISGEEIFKPARLVPKPIAWAVVLLTTALLVWFTSGSFTQSAITVEEFTFSTALWEMRGIDIVLQGFLIFAGVLVVLGLLNEGENNDASTGEIQQ